MWTPTAASSVREPYYTHSAYIAEFFCTLSNLGLLVVAWMHRDSEVLFAAVCSILSHAIPLQRLHDADILGVVVIGMKVWRNRHMMNTATVGIGAGALCINLVDYMLASPISHVVWHCAAAYALHQFLQQIN